MPERAPRSRTKLAEIRSSGRNPGRPQAGPQIFEGDLSKFGVEVLPTPAGTRVAGRNLLRNRRSLAQSASVMPMSKAERIASHMLRRWDRRAGAASLRGR